MKRLAALCLALSVFGCSSDDNGTSKAWTFNNKTTNNNKTTANNSPRRFPHRVAATDCDNLRGPGNSTNGAGNGCTEDADCQEGPNGRCNETGRNFAECSYDLCFSDDDCQGKVCHCEGESSTVIGYGGPEGNHCFVGNCQIDSDCPDPQYCSPSFDSCGDFSGHVGYFCHTFEDDCVEDSDCPGDGFYCRFSPESNRWVCDDSLCAG